MKNAQFLKTMIDFSIQFRRVFTLYIESEIDLTYPQWRVMKTIRFSDSDITAKEIADILRFDKVTISDIVNRLIRKGYITKTVDPNDRRRNVLNISQAAHSLCKSVMCVEDSFNKSLFEHMDQEQVDNYTRITNELLSKLNDMEGSKK